jgi:O-antigen ligase
MAVSIWLGLGLVLATMTGLRLSGIPVGPGEIILAGYILAVLPLRLLKLREDGKAGSRPEHSRLFLCYIVLSLLLLVGSWLGNRAGVNPYMESARDLLAYALCFLVSIAIIASHERPELAARSLRRLLWICVAITALIWIAALGFSTFGSFNPWYGGFGVRFAGLATNPNQNALLLISLPFLLLFAFRDTEITPRGRMIGVLLGAFGLAAGWGTGSAALRLTWIMLIPLALLIPVFVRGKARVLKEERNFLASLLIGALLVFLSSATFFSMLAGALNAVLGEAGVVLPFGFGTAHTDRIHLSGGAEWTDRFVLWKNAWLVIKESLLFGYGPGPLSGLEAPFGGSEAHNSLLDWSMATGLIGVAFLVTLIICVAWRSLATGNTDLFFALGALSMFGMAHQVLRHPFVWAMLTLIAIAASRQSAPGQSGAEI